MRYKTKLTYITNEKVRKATFMKRKRGFMKKIHAMSTLCGVEAFAIIYNPFNYKPEPWPSHEGVLQVLSIFKAKSELEQSSRMVNQESFLNERIAKINEQVKKTNKNNHEREINQVMFECFVDAAKVEDLNLEDLIDLGCMIDRYLIDVQAGINTISKASPSIAPVFAAALAGRNGGNEELEKQRRFMNWMRMQEQEQKLGFNGDNGIMLPFEDNLP